MKEPLHKNWRKNIPLSVRYRVFLRDWYIQHVNNPYQVLRRKNGFAERDIFRHVKIQTNYKCTRKCTFCHYGLDTPPHNIDMEEGLFFKIIDQLKTISFRGSLGLFEINEPLTDKRIYDFLCYSRNNLPYAWLILTTNGDLLNHKNAELLFASGLNYMYLNSYDDAARTRNIQLLNNIDARYTKNIVHIDRTYQIDWGSRAGNVAQHKQEKVLKPCDYVYNVLYIKPSGKVYSCINDFYNINEMGDLNKQSILEAWFSDSFKTLRKSLDNGDRNCNALCKQCDYVGYTNMPKIPFLWKLNPFFSYF